MAIALYFLEGDWAIAFWVSGWAIVFLRSDWAIALEQVMREENISFSLPVVTISNADHLLNYYEYRNRCLDKLIEVVLDIDNYRGTK